MKRIISSRWALIVAIIAFLGGFLWALNSSWAYEPVILMVLSVLEIIGYFLVQDTKEEPAQVSSSAKQKNTQNVEVNVNVGGTKEKESYPIKIEPNRDDLLELKKDKVGILFIDDDKEFNVVKILKDSGWKKTKTIEDVKSLDTPLIKKSNIIFVDINGVGKLLQLEYEGLDLALMLKQKYPNKKVIIYSANKKTNAFHDAWEFIDQRLEKNALPYQFQNLVENFSLEF